ncbi:MAG TPA: 2TM domain-containing protein [Thermoanaerobaculia bacterium]|nr:2TM domain-containing protein [Thermoanaerobaculia bacterium]
MAEDPIETTAAAPATSEAERERHRRYLAARRRAHELRSFYQHALIYLVVNAILASVNLLSDPGEIWFVFPLIGWGIGLAIHGFTTFGFGGLFGPEWERRKIEQLLAADEKRGRR